MAGEMRTVGEFMKALQTKPGCDFGVLFKDWLGELGQASERAAFLAKVATLETLSAARLILSVLYKGHYMKVCRGCSKGMCQNVVKKHETIIANFDTQAREWGIEIKEPMPIISGEE